MSIGRKWFGKREASVSGATKWTAQDSSLTWTDGGAVRQAVDESNKVLISQLERIVADNATAGVSDYLSTAEVGLRAEATGEVIVGLRVSNEQADLIVEIPLRKLIVDALQEMRPRLGVDPESQAVLSALIAFGNSLVALGQRKEPGPSPNAMPVGLPGQAARPTPIAPPGRLSPTRQAPIDDTALAKQWMGLTQ